jgi:uncharacterized coiled-coil protein SlyX
MNLLVVEVMDIMNEKLNKITTELESKITETNEELENNFDKKLEELNTGEITDKLENLEAKQDQIIDSLNKCITALQQIQEIFNETGANPLKNKFDFLTWNDFSNWIIEKN